MFPPRNQQRRSLRTSSSFIRRNKLKGLLAIIALCVILCVIYAVSGTNGSNIRVQFTPFVDVKAYEHSLHTQSTSQLIDERERRGLSGMQNNVNWHNGSTLDAQIREMEDMKSAFNERKREFATRDADFHSALNGELAGAQKLIDAETEMIEKQKQMLQDAKKPSLTGQQISLLHVLGPIWDDFLKQTEFPLDIQDDQIQKMVESFKTFIKNRNVVDGKVKTHF